MKITNPHYLIRNGRQLLRIEVDGVEAFLHTDVKPTLFANGYVFLGAQFEDIVPEIKLSAADINKMSKGRGNASVLTLKGFTQDPEVVHWQRQLFYDLNTKGVTTGPVERVEIPADALKR